MIKKSTLFFGMFIILFVFNSCSSFFRFINYSPSTRLVNVEFSSDTNTAYKFYYSDTLNNDYLRRLRNNYGLDTLISNSKNQLESVKIVLAWTRRQWNHSGSNTPQKSDAISILEEAKAGKSFRCVEYGIVSAAALNSIGLPARVIGLKSRDVEKVKYGAGHVAAEVYLPELKKWVFLDGQFNAIAMLNNVPLNAVELKHAIQMNRSAVKIVSLNRIASEKERDNYLNFVSKYLFYFDINFDNRIGTVDPRLKINGKNKLMLVPLNQKNPTIFQRKYPIDYCEYSNSYQDFYRTPELH